MRHIIIINDVDIKEAIFVNDVESETLKTLILTKNTLILKLDLTVNGQIRIIDARSNVIFYINEGTKLPSDYKISTIVDIETIKVLQGQKEITFKTTELLKIIGLGRLLANHKK